MAEKREVIVVGGGAAGLMAAVQVRYHNRSCILLEKNDSCGKKVNLAGGSRGNFTNLDHNLSHLGAAVENPITSKEKSERILRPLFQAFDTKAIRSFFNEIGLPSVVEAEQRVFPSSQKASDITQVLETSYRKALGTIYFQHSVDQISIDENEEFPWKVLCKNKKEFFAKAVIVATGGASFPHTGSTGDGNHFFEALGLETIEFSPALAPLLLLRPFPSELAGISIDPVSVRYQLKGKNKNRTITRKSSLLFQKKGLSGPLILSASGDLYSNEYIERSLEMNFLGDEDDEGFLKKLDYEIEQGPKKKVSSFLAEFLPRRLADVLWSDFTLANDIHPDVQLSNFSKRARYALVQQILHFPIEPSSPPPLRVAMLSRGGLSINEINFRTMEIKKTPGLFVAGEAVDFDFMSGGFNLSFAWQSGYLAAKSATAFVAGM